MTDGNIRHISLTALQNLRDGEQFHASFSPQGSAHLYEMGTALRDFVVHRAHNVHGSWLGRCDHSHDSDEGTTFTRMDQDVICEGCHHRIGNHPICRQYTWLNVVCGGKHVKL